MPTATTTFYFDRFRGFSDTRLTLSDVNFFVGENSTGKSSILSAIQIFLSDSLWLHGRFKTEHVDLGSFSEMASPGCKDFLVGLYVEASEHKKRSSTKNTPLRAVLMSFSAGSGEPRISSLCVLAGPFEAILEYSEEGKSGRYVIKEVSQDDTERTVFDRWLKRKPLTKRARELGAGAANLSDCPMFLISFVLAQHDLSSSKKSKSPNVDTDSERIERLSNFVGMERPLAEPLWIAPIRAKPRRIYERRTVAYSPEGAHIPHWISEVSGTGKHWNTALSSLAQYAKDGHLFQGLMIRRFGNDSQAPFDVQIQLDAISTSIHNVGYGVSQSLPVLAESILRSPGDLLAIQQPEVHLHPRAQAVLGDLFFDMSAPPNSKRFLIETHSDYVIDRFRSRMLRRYREAGSDASITSAQVVYFRRHEGRNELHSMVLSPSGEYPETQPPGFREFFLEEDLRVLGLEVGDVHHR